MSTVPDSHLYILTGASRGLGRAMLTQLLQAGHTVLTMSRRPDESAAMQAQAAGAQLEQWAVDLANPLPVAEKLRLWLQAPARAQHLWASVTLINNAGVMPAIVPLRDAPAQGLSDALRVGLEAPLVLSSAFADATRDWTGVRRLLNISSGLGRRPMASQEAYCAAKAGLDLFTRCLALGESHHANPLRACALAPGVVDTDMQQHLRQADARGFPDHARFARLHAAGELTDAQEAARRVLAWLARPDFGQEPLGDVRQA